MIANILKQWLIMLLLTTVRRSSCEIAAEITVASTASDDEGRVDLSNSALKPDSRRAVNCITLECVDSSSIVVVDAINMREQNSSISNAGVEKVLMSVLLYKEVCIPDSPIEDDKLSLEVDPLRAFGT